MELAKEVVQSLPEAMQYELRRLGFSLNAYTLHQLTAIANAQRVGRHIAQDPHADLRNIYDLIEYSTDEEALDHELEEKEEPQADIHGNTHAPLHIRHYNAGYHLGGLRPCANSNAPCGFAERLKYERKSPAPESTATA